MTPTETIDLRDGNCLTEINYDVDHKPRTYKDRRLDKT